jgi:hypothetical protein
VINDPATDPDSGRFLKIKDKSNLPKKLNYICSMAIKAIKDVKERSNEAGKDSH